MATAADVDAETFADRLRAEAVAKRAVFAPPPRVWAWTSLPSA